MPELSRFFGIIVPHFHAWYQEQVGVFGIDPVDLLAGELPLRQRRLVEAWAELHQAELLADWELLHFGPETAADRAASASLLRRRF